MMNRLVGCYNFFHIDCAYIHLVAFILSLERFSCRHLLDFSHVILMSKICHLSRSGMLTRCYRTGQTLDWNTYLSVFRSC